jgi:hypothetical protein
MSYPSGKKKWAREPKGQTAHSTVLLKNFGVGNRALREIDVRSLLKHRAL